MLVGEDSYKKYNTGLNLKKYWINKKITENIKITDMNRDNMNTSTYSKLNSVQRSNKKFNNS